MFKRIMQWLFEPLKKLLSNEYREQLERVRQEILDAQKLALEAEEKRKVLDAERAEHLRRMKYDTDYVIKHCWKLNDTNPHVKRFEEALAKVGKKEQEKMQVSATVTIGKLKSEHIDVGHLMIFDHHGPIPYIPCPCKRGLKNTHFENCPDAPFNAGKNLASFSWGTAAKPEPAKPEPEVEPEPPKKILGKDLCTCDSESRSECLVHWDKPNYTAEDEDDDKCHCSNDNHPFVPPYHPV